MKTQQFCSLTRNLDFLSSTALFCLFRYIYSFSILHFSRCKIMRKLVVIDRTMIFLVRPNWNHRNRTELWSNKTGTFATKIRWGNITPTSTIHSHTNYSYAELHCNVNVLVSVTELFHLSHLSLKYIHIMQARIIKKIRIFLRIDRIWSLWQVIESMPIKSWVNW